MNIPNIQLYIKKRHGFNIDYHVIYNIRSNKFNHLIYGCIQKSQGTSVDNLIKLFEKSDSVSFVYIKHRYHSGFVTFRKSKNEKQIEKYLSKFNNNQINQLSTKSIVNWRESLRLSESNDVLVAFAWSHDEEIKSAEKNPDFLQQILLLTLIKKEESYLLLLELMEIINHSLHLGASFLPNKNKHILG